MLGFKSNLESETHISYNLDYSHVAQSTKY